MATGCRLGVEPRSVKCILSLISEIQYIDIAIFFAGVSSHEMAGLIFPLLNTFPSENLRNFAQF